MDDERTVRAMDRLDPVALLLPMVMLGIGARIALRRRDSARARDLAAFADRLGLRFSATDPFDLDRRPTRAWDIVGTAIAIPIVIVAIALYGWWILFDLGIVEEPWRWFFPC